MMAKNLNAGSFVIFRGSGPVLLKNNSFVIFQVWGPDPLVPPLDPRIHPMVQRGREMRRQHHKKQTSYTLKFKFNDTRILMNGFILL